MFCGHGARRKWLKYHKRKRVVYHLHKIGCTQKHQNTIERFSNFICTADPLLCSTIIRDHIDNASAWGGLKDTSWSGPPVESQYRLGIKLHYENAHFYTDGPGTWSVKLLFKIGICSYVLINATCSLKRNVSDSSQHPWVSLTLTFK